MTSGGSKDRSAGGGGASRAHLCPLCGKPAVEGFKPFCSKRCADIDLGKWFSNSYAIPGQGQDDEAESPRPPADDASDRD